MTARELLGGAASLLRRLGRTRDASDAEWRREARRRVARAEHRRACLVEMLQRFPEAELLLPDVGESWVLCLDGDVTVGVGAVALTRCLESHRAQRGTEAQSVRIGFAYWTLGAPRRKGGGDV